MNFWRACERKIYVTAASRMRQQRTCSLHTHLYMIYTSLESLENVFNDLVRPCLSAHVRTQQPAVR